MDATNDTRCCCRIVRHRNVSEQQQCSLLTPRAGAMPRMPATNNTNLCVAHHDPAIRTAPGAAAQLVRGVVVSVKEDAGGRVLHVRRELHLLLRDEVDVVLGVGRVVCRQAGQQGRAHELVVAPAQDQSIPFRQAIHRIVIGGRWEWLFTRGGNRAGTASSFSSNCPQPGFALSGHSSADHQCTHHRKLALLSGWPLHPESRDMVPSGRRCGHCRMYSSAHGKMNENHER